jgi:para-nitrobenzyl esterase
LYMNLFGGSLLLLAASALDGPIVDVPALGKIQGRTEGAVETFKGIPYSIQPVGNLRFAPASPVKSWFPKILNATAFGAQCHQDGIKDYNEYPEPEAPLPSEECLFVNVWRPTGTKPGDNLDVMVYIHGGGFCIGAGSKRWLNGTNLALKQNVMVVNMNYRLGVLGFLVHDELQQTYGANGGMNGLRDQREALRFVQSHISSFGGNPDKVTIFGQSSGGMSTCIHGVAPPSNGLFSKVIIQSGACINMFNAADMRVSGWGPGSADYGAKVGLNLLAALNITSVAGSLAQLRQLKPELLQWPADIATTSVRQFPGYYTDGFMIPANSTPLSLYTTGRLNAQAYIVGATSKDGTGQAYGGYTPTYARRFVSCFYACTVCMFALTPLPSVTLTSPHPSSVCDSHLTSPLSHLTSPHLTPLVRKVFDYRTS